VLQLVKPLHVFHKTQRFIAVPLTAHPMERTLQDEATPYLWTTCL